MESKLKIREFQEESYKSAREHGFYQQDTSFIECLALIHSEVSEALEEVKSGHKLTETYYSKSGKPEGVASEMADIVIRVFNTAEHFGIDLESAIKEKQDFNIGRPFMHGKKF